MIVSGEQLVDASSGFSEGQPAVIVKLDARGAAEMLETTRQNLGRPMAVVFIEKKRVTETDPCNGVRSGNECTEEEVISIATIRGVFGSNFQVTGLLAGEARELALLLRAGSLAAPLYIVEQRTVGPSLGQDNVTRGFQALMIGLVGMFIFLAVYYRRFGVVACLVLFMNMVLLTALMSLLQATLSLPGIAGIVLTVGMAADANVLIYERIREELRNGMSPHAAINAGFDKAFSAIADSNITTLIAGVVLFTFGTGPVRGFAVTLCLGILTSLFSHHGIFQEENQFPLHAAARAVVRHLGRAAGRVVRPDRHPRPEPWHRLHRRRGAGTQLPAGGGPRQGARRARGCGPRGRDRAELWHRERGARAVAAEGRRGHGGGRPGRARVAQVLRARRATQAYRGGRRADRQGAR
jgi:protein-export membrane protein SecD